MISSMYTRAFILLSFSDFACADPLRRRRGVAPTAMPCPSFRRTHMPNLLTMPAFLLIRRACLRTRLVILAALQLSSSQQTLSQGFCKHCCTVTPRQRRIKIWLIRTSNLLTRSVVFAVMQLSLGMVECWVGAALPQKVLLSLPQKVANRRTIPPLP